MGEAVAFSLENGDHLAQPEFHRRYAERPELKKWFELVDGAYHRIPPGPDGLRESRVFPGLKR